MISPDDITPFRPAQPYFDLIREGLGNEVDGRHFFDCVAENIHYEVRYELPGWPRIITGKSPLMAAFASYCEHMVIYRAALVSATTGHVTDADTSTRVVTLEYDVDGAVLARGTPYHNRFCSVIELAQGKMAVWRDYMDSLAAWRALAAQN